MMFLEKILPRAIAAATIFVFAGCSLVAPLDYPEVGSEFARTGPYVGLYGIHSFENFSISDSSVKTGDSDLGVGGRLGFRFSPELAVEVVGENVRGFDISRSSVNANLSLTNVGAMGKYFLASDRFQPYVLAGGGVAIADVNKEFDYDTNGGFLRGGIGMDVYLIRTLALFGEVNYNHMMGGVSDLHHIDVMAGVMFRF